VSNETLDIFKFQESAIPVLGACACDSDSNVRWPAVILLGSVARGNSRAALSFLCQALKDENVEVRLQAIRALKPLGANAANAGPQLVALTRDGDPQIRSWADKALWEINIKLAAETGGWQTFESPRWNFTASFPAPPVEAQTPNFLAPNRLVTTSFSARHGVTCCTVAVTEYPVDLYKGTDDERLSAARDLALLGVGGKLLNEQIFERGPIKGREFTVEATVERDGDVLNKTLLRSRVFWIQRRFYHVQVAYNSEFSILPAVNYFLDSFESRPVEKMP
jgi:HEAT repeats